MDVATPTADSAVTGRRVARNTAANLAGSVVVFVLALVMTPFLLERLGTAEYGVWVLALTLTYTVGYAGIADLGMQQALVRMVADREALEANEEINRLVSTTVAAFTVLGVVGAAALVAFSGLFTRWFDIDDGLQGAAQLAFAVVGAQLAVDLVTGAFRSVLEGTQRFAAVRFVEIGPRAAWAVLAVPVVLTGHGVVALAVASLLVALVMAVVAVRLAKRACPGLRVSWHLVDAPAARALAREATGFLTLRVSSIVYSQMDRLILGVLLGAAAVARYDVAYKFHAIAAMILALAPSALMPAASYLGAQGDTDRLRSLYQRGTRLAVAATCAVTLSAMVFARPLLSVWVGEDYADLAGTTRLYLVYPLLVSIHVIGLTMVVGLGRLRQVAALSVASVGLNLVLSILLVPRLGLIGVVWGTTIGYLVLWVPYLRIMTRELGVGIGEFLVNVLGPVMPGIVAQVAAGLLILNALPDDPNTFLVIVAAGLCSAVGLGVFFLFGLDRDERRSLVTVAVQAAR
jgi:O-antigen/teichoic acid export membrane protein